MHTANLYIEYLFVLLLRCYFELSFNHRDDLSSPAAFLGCRALLFLAIATPKTSYKHLMAALVADTCLLIFYCLRLEKIKKAASRTKLLWKGAEDGSRTHTPDGHTPLKRARLPIPPLRLKWTKMQEQGTEGGNRTRTILLSLDFESSASTSSATSADGSTDIKLPLQLVRCKFRKVFSNTQQISLF